MMDGMGHRHQDSSDERRMRPPMMRRQGSILRHRDEVNLNRSFNKDDYEGEDGWGPPPRGYAFVMGCEDPIRIQPQEIRVKRRDSDDDRDDF